jgi:hypothetical protein
MNASPLLRTGDPADPKKAASFTRFVLPFAYKLARYEENAEPLRGPQFREATGSDWFHSASKGAASFDKERRAYLTPEVGNALYNRAKWFVLEDKAEAPFLNQQATVQVKDKTVDVRFRTPGLVMFEYEDEHLRFCNEHNGASQCLATGFLVLEAWYEGPLDFDSLLVWNEVARYWQSPFEGHFDKTTGPILQRLGDFQDYEQRWKRFLELPLYDPCRNNLQNGYIKILPGKDWNVHPDNRTFVWTCAMSDRKTALSRDSGEWQALLNVDKWRRAAPTAFDLKWLEDRTYMRWAEDGTLYGFTGHSGAMLTNDTSTNPPIWQHFRSMYFDQLLLMLYLRTGIFRFSRHLTELACNHSRQQLTQADQPTPVNFEEEFDRLRWEFSHFTNLYQFPLISHQQQAVEMYALLREQLDVNDFYNEVSTEITTTRQLLADKVASRQNQVTTALAYVAYFGLLVGTLVGVWGLAAPSKVPMLNWAIMSVVLGLLVWPVFSKPARRFCEKLFHNRFQ